jgi:adenine C2-methylase RlmN of 23S rRNA A2503 and tRNA A37
MGINKQWPIKEVLKACQEYIDSRLAALLEKKKKTGNELVVDNDDTDDDEEDDDNNTTSITPLSTKEVHTERYYNNGANRIRVTFEYVLLEGINDSDSTALELAKLLQSHIRNASVYTHVNLIHFNEWPGSSYKRSSEERMTSFQQVLLKNRIISTVRRSRGLDILGACGQLKSTKQLKQVTC